MLDFDQFTFATQRKTKLVKTINNFYFNPKIKLHIVNLFPLPETTILSSIISIHY